MECPDPAVLEALAVGGASVDDRPALEAHLDSCAECTQIVAQLAKLFGDSGADVTVEATSGDGGSLRPPTGTAPPAILGRYQLGRRLGAGGMGVVFEARDPELDRKVAIKLLHGGRGAAALKARLLREARAMARVAHPNVVAVHDIGSVGDQVFIAMELVEGTTLTEWLAERRRSRGEIVRVFAEAGRGLAAAHAVDMVHRDFKPDNVLLGADGRARVTDFGLARALDDNMLPTNPSAPEEHPISSEIGLSLTRTAPGAIVGTPAYMAPEQLRAERADAASDQFSFCVAFYEALVGKRPFDGASFDELARNVATGHRPAVPSTVPRWLRGVLDRGLQRDPTDRYPTMAALVAELERDRGLPRRIAATAAAMCVAAAFTVGVLYWWTGLTTPEVATDTPNETVGGPGSATDEATCAVRSLVRERWSKGRQDAFRTALNARAIADATLAEATMDAADRWTAAWSKQHERLCKLSDEQQRAPLQTCLARRFRTFDAIVSHVIDQRDGYANEHALSAIGSLVSAEQCDNDARLAVQPTSALDAGKRATATALEIELAQLWARFALRQPGSDEDAERLVTRASDLGDPLLTAEAMWMRGLTLHANGQPDEASKHLEAAVAQAQAAKHDEVISAAALALAEIDLERMRLTAMKRWLRIVDADATRFADRPLEAASALLHGQAIHARGDFRDAHDPLRRALNLSRSAFGDTHPRTAVAYAAYAELLTDLQRHDEAIERAQTAVAFTEKLAGPRSLPLGRARVHLGRALLANGDTAKAISVLRSAVQDLVLATRINAPRDEMNFARESLAAAYEANGQHDLAMKALTDSELSRRSTWRWAAALNHLGELEVRRGDHAAGLAHLDQALADLEKRFGPDDMRLVPTLRALGRSHGALLDTAPNHAPKARKALTRAMAIVDHGIGYEPLRAFIELELADVEHGAKRFEAELKHRDDAHVLTSSAYGMDDLRTTYGVLARADLAYTLGQKAYAGRLYRSPAKRLTERFGPDHADAKRARERATPPDRDAAKPATKPGGSENVKEELRQRIQQIQEETAEKVQRKLDGE